MREELSRSESRKRPSNGHIKQVLLMTPQNLRRMKTLLTILVAVAGMQASAWTVLVQEMPVSPFADTEVSTNVPINRADISYADLKFCFAGTPTNDMNVSGVNAADFGALVSNVPPAWIWRREWNLMRATRRGTEPPSDWIDYSASHRGFAIRLR